MQYVTWSTSVYWLGSVTACVTDSVSPPTPDSSVSVDLFPLRFLMSIKPKIASIMLLRECPFFLFQLEWDGSVAAFQLASGFGLRLVWAAPPHYPHYRCWCWHAPPMIGKLHPALSLHRCLGLVGQIKFGGNLWLCLNWKACPTGRSVSAPFSWSPWIYDWPINNRIYWVRWLIHIKSNTN